MISPFFDHEGRVVSILGRIESAEINLLADQLLRLDNDNSDEITLYVSSIGGDLIDGLKVLDIMSTLDSPVTAIAMGLVQGAGVLIFAAAPERVILPNAMLSTANLWAIPGLEASPAFGFGASARQPRDLLLTQLEAQVEKLGPPRLCQLVREAATAPRLFTAEQAIACDLADALVPVRKTIQSVHVNPIRHVR